MGHRTARSLALAAALPCVTASADDAGDVWRLDPEAAGCLVQSLETYRAAPVEPVIIVLGACPQVDPVAALARMTQSNGTPRVRTAPGDGPDEVIVFTRAELECLDAGEFVESDGVVLVPRVPAC
ncbi:hypothetical protein GCM10011392_31030 [Wenxinia marina]|uniref:Wenxma_18, whole genome shotgun sequence n=2 Tax=Wenxinia TaxID=653686 RepID=A0A0D0PZV5_9RHOB|nr:hypothetical protein [Wenxinia marina]KIQ67894.1 hypothetical protein Wenmar_03624 [Wenxinia marina DSM 24838]GGL74287.1 hypothetical protein GCM10011392_31030 [Wenxinia marina]